MKPISLKISGLNSFIEPVAIDFTLLTERGVFGIFGPTGSGKSTILDAMTLALYGDIPRNTKNYINANSKSATVVFDFQISGKEPKQYRVEREFKRESNGQNARTSKARLTDITNNEVLEEKATAINELCSEIIGLSKEDFGRTVVLPQGKFSEFLKLEGSKKREMLERLFNLQQYGDELNNKVNKQAIELKAQKDNLEGYLASYNDLQQIDFAGLEEEIQKNEILYKDFESKLKEEEKEFEILKSRWEKQQELDLKEKELVLLKEKQEEYTELEFVLAKGKQAKVHMPYIKNYESLIAEKETLENSIKIQNMKLDIMSEREVQEKEDLGKKEQEKNNSIEAVKRQEALVKSLSFNMEGRNYLQEAESLKSRIKLGNETIENELSLKGKYENSIKAQEESEKVLDVTIQMKIKELEELEINLLALEKKKEELQKSQMAAALSQKLHQGDDCPICGNKILNLISKMDGSALENIENHKKAVQLQKNTVENALSKAKEEKAKLKGQSETLKEALDKTKENVDKYKLALEDREYKYIEVLNCAAKELGYKEDVRLWDSVIALEEIKRKENLKLKEEKVLEKFRIAYENIEQLYILSNKAYQDTLLERTKLETTTVEVGKNIIEVQAKLKKAVLELEESFKMEFKDINIPQVKLDFIPENQQEVMESKISQYKNLIGQLIGVIENLKQQLKIRIKSEEYERIVQNLNKRKNDLKEVRERLLLAKEKLDQTQKRIKEQKIAVENLEKISHRLGLVEELKKLFAGKRFVSYVARNQLIYIAREASKRLMDITGGSYELQVDEDGKFQIIDYKNGATLREVSSLSGGEVFIASLALALALAAHIQLKGANLELFFLDEGFGTLDEDLLEVVMTSIEKIHNEKLAIGLISHVESIKQRVPIKLVVSPAESGGIGSKVRIEY